MAKKALVRKTLRRHRRVPRPRLMRVPLKVVEPVKPATNLKNKLVGAILILFILAALAYNFKQLFVVALVNQRPITRFAFDRQLEKQGGKNFLENEIDRQLILQEAAKQKVGLQNAEVDDKIREIQKQVESRGGKLEDLLSLQGQTVESLKDQLKIQLLIEKILGKDISVAEEEIKTYYDENKASLAQDKSFDELKGSISQQLRQQKLSEKVAPWLKDLRAKANIQYFLQF
jgi:foldase protein PrsA